MNGAVRPLPDEWVRAWVVRLHGFESQPADVALALARASHYLTVGDEAAAQNALDLSKLDRVSPEGAALMSVVAARFGIEPAALPVGGLSAPWGTGNLTVLARLFDPFAAAAIALERDWLEKEWDETKHPRWPQGAPARQGGRFAPGQQSPSTSAGAEPPSPAEPTPSPGIGHNWLPRPDDPPVVPEEEPPTAQLRNAIIKDVAMWLLRRGVLALVPGVGEALVVIQLGVWLYQYLPFINAYLSGPKTLAELNADAARPAKGYDIHHIVEQNPARGAGFSESQIESPENRVRISTLKHWEMNGWYSTPNNDFGGLSPRLYLRDKDWAERVRVGREALVRFGVLKQ
jgi:hypothetical protein